MELYRLFSPGESRALASDSNPMLVTDIEIMRTGMFRTAQGKIITITEKMLDDFVANFHQLRSKGYFTNVPARINHGRDMNELVGYVEDVRRVGDRLVVDQLFTEPGPFEKFKNGTLRSRSAEFGSFEVVEEKKTYSPVLRGFAWVDIPAVDKLAPVAASVSGDVEILTLTPAPFDQEADEGAHHQEPPGDGAGSNRTPIRRVVMSKFAKSDIAEIKLHNGNIVTDVSLMEEPEAPEVFTLTIGEQTLNFADQASADAVTEMARERDEAVAEAAKVETASRESYVDSLKEAGKILGSDEALADEKTFVTAFTTEQYAAYVKRMDAQPPIVNLGAPEGQQGDGGADDPQLADLKATLEFQRKHGASEADIKHLTAKIEELETLNKTT